MPKIKNRRTFQVRVYNYLHTLIEQHDARPDKMQGSYLGNKGFVLHKVEKFITI